MKLGISANRERVIDTFIELAQIPSPLMKVRRIMNQLVRIVEGDLRLGYQFDQAGIEKEGFECGNMIVNVPATSGFESLPCKGIEAHVDTVAVEGLIHVVETPDVIRTVGTTILGADDKAGVTAILEALRLLQENKIAHGPIQVLFTVGEELSMYGVREMDCGLVKAESIVSVDGLEGNTLWRSCAAKLKYRAIFKGKEGHGAFPEQGLNSIIMAAQALEMARSHKLFGEEDDYGIIRGISFETTVWHNVAEILSHTKGDSMFPSTNVIPGTTIVCGEFRAFEKVLLKTRFQQLEKCFQSAAMARSGDRQVEGSVEFETEYPYEPFCLEETHPLVQEVLTAMKAARIFDVRADITPGATHANVFNMHGIPSVVLGTGCRKPHSREEHVVIDEMVQAAEVLTYYLAAK